MKKLQILGPGCPKCEELTKRTEEAAKALGLEYELEKIKDLNQMMALGVFMTPALVVDGQVKSVGKVPSQEELKQMLS